MSFSPAILAADHEARFRDFIADKDFPCVGAKAALSRGRVHIVTARDIRSAYDDLTIHAAVMKLAHGYEKMPTMFQTLAVVFDTDAGLSEAAYERAMWDRLQSISDKDAWLGQPLASGVENDPDSPHFALSFGGQAFFIVGLHPNASRPARRFSRPAMVFNLHAQFEMLRAQGKYDSMRQTIIERDIALAGSPNPMLSEHGKGSAARQYSGRVVGADWQCPFHGRKTLTEIG